MRRRQRAVATAVVERHRDTNRARQPSCTPNACSRVFSRENQRFYGVFRRTTPPSQPEDENESAMRRTRSRSMPTSLDGDIITLHGDIILHLCELCTPLCPQKMYTIVPALSGTCRGFRVLLRMMVKDLKKVVLAIGALKCPELVRVLRQRYLHVQTGAEDKGDCVFEDEDDVADTRLVKCPVPEAERLLAALLPLRGLAHLQSLVLSVEGAPTLDDENDGDGDDQFVAGMVQRGFATLGAAHAMKRHRRNDRRHRVCFEIARALGALPRGALPRLERLNLSGNLLSLARGPRQSGLSALAASLGSGAMRRLVALRLCQAGLDDAAVGVLGSALVRGGLACTLRKLSLDENHIHDLGPLAPCHLAHLNAAFNPLDMAHLAESLERGALPALRSVYLTVHQLPSPVESEEDTEELGGRLALKAACEARNVTCHCSILPEDAIFMYPHLQHVELTA